MGRQAAGEAFMRGFISHYGNAELDLLLHTPKETNQAQRFLSTEYGVQNVNTAHLWGLHKLNNQTLYLPSPGIGEMAVHRAKYNERAFSLCGVTHTTATHRVQQTLADLPLDPVRPWDALICTSSSVKQSVEIILEERMDYLRWKLGATRIELPQLPVIPLGVHCSDYHNIDKNQARLALNIPPQDIVVIYVGRLSFHAKAHPHPMLDAIQQATAELNDNVNVHLIQCGWFANEHIENAFTDAQTYLAPNIIHHHIDGRIKSNVKDVWASADIFISLSDNIQETFGLTPIEAMAAGIPVVVSDWNGYKDTIVHGETGFRIKTTMPRADGIGQELANRYATGQDSYDMYCGHSCETISVDIPDTVACLVQLMNSPELRDTLGNAGKQRALQRYDWSVVMRQYHELWEQLAQIRTSHTEKFGVLPHKVMAQNIDPYRLFSHYPSVQLNSHSQFSINNVLTEARYTEICGLSGHSFAKFILPKYADIKLIQMHLQAHPQATINELSIHLARAEVSLEITLSWLMKIGVLSIQQETI